jgi:hypothetical protein
MKKLIALTAALLTSSSAFAGIWTSTVDQLQVDAEGYVEFGTITTPTNGICHWFSNIFRFNTAATSAGSITSAGGKNMLATLMSAKIAGIPVTIQFNDSTTPGQNQNTTCTQATMAVVTSVAIR